MTTNETEPLYVCQYYFSNGQPQRGGYTVHKSRAEAEAEADEANAAGKDAAALTLRRTCETCGDFLTFDGPLGGGCSECR